MAEFPNGLFIKEAKPKFVLCKISIRKAEFAQWLQEQEGDWVNLDACIGKSGKPYAKVDDWKPDGQGQSQQQDSYDQRNGHDEYEQIPDEDLPF